MAGCRRWNPPGKSHADAFKERPAEEQRERLGVLSRRELLALEKAWGWWARPAQLPPPTREIALPESEEWRYWIIFAGRMWGKSRTAAEWLRGKIERGEARSIVLAAPRYEDVERIMIANLYNVFPTGRKPKYNRDAHRLSFWPWTPDAPHADICTGEKPDGFRGPEWDCGWLDEFAAFTKLSEVWELLLPAMRAKPPKGGVPQIICTTTPRNKPVLHALLENPQAVLTLGASAENAHNVAGGVLEAVRFIYQDSDLAAQELGGQLLGNEPGALFRQEWFTAHRAPAPRFKKKIVVVDTSGSGKDTACECGIVLLGLAEDGTPYVLGDFSVRASPLEWAKRMYDVYLEHKADEIVYECHYGGQLVPSLFTLLKIRAKLVPHPAVGTKAERAQPVRALVQNGRVKFVGAFKQLEMQCCTWVPGDNESPDRMDAFVHGVTYLVPAIRVARGTIVVPGMY